MEKRGQWGKKKNPNIPEGPEGRKINESGKTRGKNERKINLWTEKKHKNTKYILTLFFKDVNVSGLVQNMWNTGRKVRKYNILCCKK